MKIGVVIYHVNINKYSIGELKLTSIAKKKRKTKSSPWASWSSARRPTPHTWSKGLASAKILLPVFKRWRFLARFCQNLAEVPCENGVFSFTLPNGVVETTRTLRPTRWCGLGILRRAPYDFRRTVDVEEARLISIIIDAALRAGTRNVVDDKTPTAPCPSGKTTGGRQRPRLREGGATPFCRCWI